MMQLPARGETTSPKPAPLQADTRSHVLTSQYDTNPNHKRDRSIEHTRSKRPKRKFRATPFYEWEQYDRQAGSMYSIAIVAIAKRCPELTPMELRVASLVRVMQPSWKIAEILRVTEDTVENHRVNIRRKLQLTPDQNLQQQLIQIT